MILTKQARKVCKKEGRRGERDTEWNRLKWREKEMTREGSFLLIKIFIWPYNMMN